MKNKTRRSAQMIRRIRGIYRLSLSFLTLFLLLLTFAFEALLSDGEKRRAFEPSDGVLGSAAAQREALQKGHWYADSAWLAQHASQLRKQVADAGIRGVTVYSRLKDYDSALQKANRRGIDVRDVKDLYGIRVVVDNELDVYRTLNFICSNYELQANSLKNYIVSPKESGYQSVHVVAKFEDRKIEFQLRTTAMHIAAEEEHAAYKERMYAA